MGRPWDVHGAAAPWFTISEARTPPPKSGRFAADEPGDVESVRVTGYVDMNGWARFALSSISHTGVHHITISGVISTCSS